MIEEVLDGEEASFFALCDGTRGSPSPPRRITSAPSMASEGPNTGGMGAYSPARILDDALRGAHHARDHPADAGRHGGRGRALQGRALRRTDDRPDGPKLIEFNVRFGDPEAQVILPRLEEDFLALVLACMEEDLVPHALRFSPTTALSVVLAAKGYPEAPVNGTEIYGLERAEAMPFVTITHAGTKRRGGKLVADGGRVLNVTALGRRCGRGACARLRGCRRDRLGWWLLPSRHRLAGAEAVLKLFDAGTGNTGIRRRHAG